MVELCDLTVLLSQAQHSIAKETEEALKAHNLSLAKYNILAALAEAGGRLPFSVLVERLGCVRSNVTGLVDRLQEDHLVCRVDHPEDRRMLFAELTPQGRMLIEAATPCHQEAVARIFGNLTAEQQDQLGTLLRELTR